MRRHSSSSTLEFHARPNSSGALIGSLLLLGASFALLVLGPTLLARFQGSAESMPAGGYLNIAAASGIALGGGAAMIAVVSRLVRDIELRPYAALAPVLAVFTGFVLWGLHAQLPLSGVPTEYVGVFALAVSVAGGGLIAQPGGATRTVGWLLSFVAPLVLLGLLWANAGQTDVGAALATLSQPLRLFVGMLAGAALMLAILGEVARALRLRGQHTGTSSRFVTEDGLPMPRSRVAGASAAARESAEPHSLRQAIASTSTDWREQAQALPGTDAYLMQSQDFAQPAAPSEYTPSVSVWDFEEEPLKLPNQHYALKAFLMLLLIVGGGGAALYYGSILPNQQKEQAAQVQMQQRQAQIKAAEQQEAEQKRAEEAKAAAARLEELLNAPAANAATAEAPAGDAPAPAADKQAPNLGGASAIPPSR